MVEAAGVEPPRRDFFKLLMVHEFWSKSFHISGFRRLSLSTAVAVSGLDSTCIWRHFGDAIFCGIAPAALNRRGAAVAARALVQVLNGETAAGV